MADNLSDIQWMRLALESAARGGYEVEPNPLVGAVIVRNDKLVAQGWHRKFGGPHAEADAIASAALEGVSTQGAACYVTLEPCCHLGKTPPCTDALIKAGITRVVVATEDPFPLVAGKGITQLRANPQSLFME
jgi:diaminohydroxyphosphoribosylaminopyrimidine deaminase/5-amino-6-(5-phosphoribosylamino)uracil reductase